MLLALAAMVSLQPDDVQPNCAGNTLEVNACLAGKVKTAQERLDRYVQAALERYGSDEPGDAAIRLGITASQDAFEAYRSIECDAVYENWKEGTIRGAMGATCAIGLTDQRTHVVWEHWLRYMDSTPPILAEPKPTE